MEYQYYELGAISTEMFLEFKQRYDAQRVTEVLNLRMDDMRSCEETQIVNQLSTITLEPDSKHSELAQVVDQLSSIKLEESDSQHLPSSSDK